MSLDLESTGSGVMRAHKKIELLTARLAANLRLRLDLEEAAESVGIEATYFSRLFHDVMGLGYVEWNRSIRIEFAKLLLREGSLSISQVADRVGYQDMTTFERNFRRIEGVSPKEFERQGRPRRLENKNTKFAE